MLIARPLIQRLTATFAITAGAICLALTTSTARAQTVMADFNQSDHTAFQFTNSGSSSTFAISGAQFEFNYNGTVYDTVLNITAGVSGPATSDALDRDGNGTGTISENLSNVTLNFVNADSNSAQHNILTFSGGTAVLYGFLDDATDAKSNISSLGFSTLTGDWSSSVMGISGNSESSVSIGGITPNGSVSLQNNGHLNSFSAGENAVIGGFQSQPVPEAGTLLSLGGLLLSSAGVVTRYAFAGCRLGFRAALGG